MQVGILSIETEGILTSILEQTSTGWKLMATRIYTPFLRTLTENIRRSSWVMTPPLHHC